MKKDSLLSKIFNIVNIITSEYIIGTGIYLLSLFVLNVAKSLNWVNLLYWIIVFNFLFERFLLKDNRTRYEICNKNKVHIIVRVCFIIINLLAFGINIFTLNLK